MDGIKPTLDGINATVSGWWNWLADGVSGFFDGDPTKPATSPVPTATGQSKAGLLVAGVALVAAGYLLTRK